MNFRSLNDLRKDEEKPKKVTESYTGGEKSGLSVENPNDEEWAAREMSAIPDGAVKVTLYSNGYFINDGDFQSTEAGPDQEKNQKFVAELKKGYVPEQLRQFQKGGAQLSVALDNKASEAFEPPPEPVLPFQGEGITLNSAASSGAAAVNIQSTGPIQINEDLPVGSVQIRFHDGQRLSQRFNETHTIQDLRNFISSIAPVNGSYSLISGFPPKVVTADLQQTLKAADLLNNQVTQKLN
eukprot:Platyproteum_vivax@DN3749_c0_g1_i1.p1